MSLKRQKGDEMSRSPMCSSFSLDKYGNLCCNKDWDYKSNNHNNSQELLRKTFKERESTKKERLSRKRETNDSFTRESCARGKA